MKLYADGGVISRNPSLYGGTYGFVLVHRNKVVYKQSGTYTPQDMGTDKVTNNQMEMIAILLGLQYAQNAGYKVTAVISDSKVTLGRLFKGHSLTNIPTWLRELKDSTPILHIKPELVKGHAGNKWNELADWLCKCEAIWYHESKGKESK